ncbi:MAG: imidazoleglycerol-phosphate dehydratase HisB [Candidatus Freyarchaeota archaeon]|nr:imidazoleglycerol-phosphate dehydratase HisB [Candidatus Freyrarchaeum guaymaensis]
MREAAVSRKTAETKVKVKVNLDGSGVGEAKTGVKFLDHMLKTFSKHSLIDVSVEAEGDLKHHVIEDVGITLGEALKKALGDKKGIFRFGSCVIPMDDALVAVALDCGGRPYASIDLKLEGSQVEDMASQEVKHFFVSLANSLGLNLHINTLYGENDHHKVEAAFKAVAVALRQAVSIDPRRKGEVASLKEML